MKPPTKPRPPCKPPEPKEYETQESRVWFVNRVAKRTSVFNNVDPALFDLSTLTYTFEVDYDTADASLEFQCDYKEPIRVKISNHEHRLVEHTRMLEKYEDSLSSYLLLLEQYDVDLNIYEHQQRLIDAGEQDLREKLIAAGLTLKEVETTLKGRNNE